MEADTVPDEIVHLDFEVVLEEKNGEPAKTCRIKRTHPNDPTRQRCARPAAYQVGIGPKPCEHGPLDMYVCQGCWNGWRANPQQTILCATCGVPYFVWDHMTRWERL